jgi:DnaJ homolog subfamily C member 19
MMSFFYHFAKSCWDFHLLLYFFLSYSVFYHQDTRRDMLRLCSPVRQFRSKNVSNWTKHVSPYFIDTNIDNNRNEIQLQHRFYGITTRRENPLIYGGIAVFAIGASAQMGMQAYEEYQASQARKAKEAPAEPSKDNTSNAKASTTEDGEKANTEQATGEEEAGESLFSRLFSTTFYEGGFESKMTRREAALILGVRESANEKRIKDAHRRILVKNHPDRGGSAFIASKVNEAKDFLLKGKS